MGKTRKIVISVVASIIAIVVLYAVFFGFSNNSKLNREFNSSISKKAIEVDHLDTLIVDMNERIKILNTKLDLIQKKEEKQSFILTILLVISVINVFIAFTFLLMKTYLKSTLAKVSRYEDAKLLNSNAKDKEEQKK